MGDWQIETALGVLELDEKSCDEEFNACIQAIQNKDDPRVALHGILLWTQAAVVPALDSGIADLTLAALGTAQSLPPFRSVEAQTLFLSSALPRAITSLLHRRKFYGHRYAAGNSNEEVSVEEEVLQLALQWLPRCVELVARRPHLASDHLLEAVATLLEPGSTNSAWHPLYEAAHRVGPQGTDLVSGWSASSDALQNGNISGKSVAPSGGSWTDGPNGFAWYPDDPSSSHPSSGQVGGSGGGGVNPPWGQSAFGNTFPQTPPRRGKNHGRKGNVDGSAGGGRGGGACNSPMSVDEKTHRCSPVDDLTNDLADKNNSTVDLTGAFDDDPDVHNYNTVGGSLGINRGNDYQDDDDPELEAALKASMLDAHSSENYEHSNDPGYSDDAKGELDSDALAALAAADAADVAESAQVMAELKHSAARAATAGESMSALSMPATAVGSEYETAGARMDASLEAAAAKATERFQHDSYPQGCFGKKSGTTHTHLSEKRRKKEKLCADSWQEMLQCLECLWDRMQNGELELEDALDEASSYWIEDDYGSDVARAQQAVLEDELRLRVILLVSMGDDSTTTDSNRGEVEEDEDWGSDEGGAIEDAPANASQSGGITSKRGSGRTAAATRVATCQSSYVDACKVARGGYSGPPLLYAAIVDAFGRSGGHLALASIISGHNSMVTSFETSPRSMLLVHANEKDTKETDTTIGKDPFEQEVANPIADAFRLRRVMELLQTVCRATYPIFAVQAATLCGQALLSRFTTNSATHITDVLSRQHAFALVRRSSSDSSDKVGENTNSSDSVSTWLRDSKKRAALDGAVEAWKTAAWAAAAIQTNLCSSNSGNNSVAPSALPVPLSEQQYQDGESGNINNEDGIRKAPSFLEDQRSALLRLTVALPLERALLLLASPTLALRIAGLQDLRKCTIDAANEDQRAEDAAKNALSGSLSLSGESIDSSSSSTSASSSSSSVVSIDVGAANSSYFAAPRSPNSTVVEEAAAPSVHFSVGGDKAPPSPSSAELQAAIALSLAKEEPPQVAASSNNSSDVARDSARGRVEPPWQRNFVAARLSAFGLLERLLTPAYLHAELWRRCGDLLAFLAQCHQLNEDHIQSLWNLVDPRSHSGSSSNIRRVSREHSTSTGRMGVGPRSDSVGSMGDYGRLHESVRHGILKVLLQLLQTPALQTENVSDSGSSDTTTTTITTSATATPYNTIKAAELSNPSPALPLPMLLTLGKGMGNLQRRSFDSSSFSHELNGNNDSSAASSFDYPMLELASSLADASIQQQRRNQVIDSNAPNMLFGNKRNNYTADFADEGVDVNEDNEDGCDAALGVSLLWRSCRDGSGASLTLHTKALELLLAKLASSDILMLPAGRWVLSKALRTLQACASTTGSDGADLVLSLKVLSALLSPAHGALTYSDPSSTVQPREYAMSDSGTSVEAASSSSGTAIASDITRAHLVTTQVAPFLKPALKSYKARAADAAAVITNGDSNVSNESQGSHTLNGSEILSGKYYGHLTTVRAFRDFLGLALAASAAESAAASNGVVPAANMPDYARGKTSSQDRTGTEGMVELAWAALVDGALLPAEADEGYCFVAQILDNTEISQPFRSSLGQEENLKPNDAENGATRAPSEDEPPMSDLQSLTRCWRSVLRLWQSSLVSQHNGVDIYTSPLITPMSLRLLLAALHFLHVADGSLCPVRISSFPDSKSSSGSAITTTAVPATPASKGSDGTTVSKATPVEKSKQALSQTSLLAPLRFTVFSAFDLEGTDLLWGIVLGCLNEHVAAEAACALTTLCLHDANPPCIAGAHDADAVAPLTCLVERCMDCLSNANQSTFFDTRSICRCLELLNLVMDAAEPRVEAAGLPLPSSHDATAARGEPTTITVNGAFSTCPGLKTLKARSRDSTWRLRQELLVQRESLLPPSNPLAASAVLQDGLSRWTWGAFNFGANAQAPLNTIKGSTAAGCSSTSSSSPSPSKGDSDEQMHPWPPALRVGYRTFKLMLLGNDVPDERAPFADILGKNKALLAMFPSQPPPLPAGCSNISFAVPQNPQNNSSLSSNNSIVDMNKSPESDERKTQVVLRGAAAAATLKVLGSGTTFDLLLALLNQPRSDSSGTENVPLLLSHRSIAEKAWRLLMRLPTSDALSRALDISQLVITERLPQMTSLLPAKHSKRARPNLATDAVANDEDRVDAPRVGQIQGTWSKVFDTSQPPQLLYTLRLVHNLFYDTSTKGSHPEIGKNASTDNAVSSADGGTGNNSSNATPAEETASLQAAPFEKVDEKSESIHSTETRDRSRFAQLTAWASIKKPSKDSETDVNTSSGNSVSFSNHSDLQSTLAAGATRAHSSSPRLSAWCGQFIESGGLAEIVKCLKTLHGATDKEKTATVTIEDSISPPFRAVCRALLVDMLSQLIEHCVSAEVTNSGLDSTSAFNCSSALSFTPVTDEDKDVNWEEMVQRDFCSHSSICCQLLQIAQQISTTGSNNSLPAKAKADFLVTVAANPCGTMHSSSSISNWIAETALGAALALLSAAPELLLLPQKVNRESHDDIVINTDGAGYSMLVDSPEATLQAGDAMSTKRSGIGGDDKALAGLLRAALIAALLNAPSTSTREATVHALKSIFAGNALSNSTEVRIYRDISEMAGRQAAAGVLLHIIVADVLPLVALPSMTAQRSGMTNLNTPEPEIKFGYGAAHGDTTEFLALLAELMGPGGNAPLSTTYAPEIIERSSPSGSLGAAGAAACFKVPECGVSPAHEEGVEGVLSTSNAPSLHAGALFVWIARCVVSSTVREANGSNVNGTKTLSDDVLGGLLDLLCKLLARLKAADPQWGLTLADAPLASLSPPSQSATTHQLSSPSTPTQTAQTLLVFLWQRCLFPDRTADILDISPASGSTSFDNNAISPVGPTARPLVIETACLSSSFSRARALNLAKALAESSSRAAALLLTLISRQLNTGHLPKFFFRNAELQLRASQNTGSGVSSVDSGMNGSSQDEDKKLHQLLASFPSLDASSQTDIGRPDLSQQWQYDPMVEARNDARVQLSNSSSDVDDRSSKGYVGLVNLGATCYMNSFLQQVFMAPALRNAIIHATPQEDALPLSATPETASSTGKSRAESGITVHNKSSSCTVLECVQEVLSILQESDKRSCDATRKLCAAYKNYANQPINPREQQDAEEFLNGLMDQMENNLRGSEHAAILQNFLGGATTSQLVCQECGYVKARREPFFVLQLEVKGKASVEDSLRLFVEGEVLDGDNAVYCSRCAAKRPTLKRTALDADKGLPPNLFLHLKRFDFDLETFRKVKVNDRCSFPRVLNLAPYTLAHVETPENEDDVDGGDKEGMDVDNNSNLVNEADGNTLASIDKTKESAENSTIYDLAGVIVHSGTADSGHYYSYIRQRGSSSMQDSLHSESSTSSSSSSHLSDGYTDASTAAHEGSWFCFNDTSVTPFDASQLEAQCFGGRDEERLQGNSSSLSSSRLKSYSAYMLVYEQRCSSFLSSIAAPSNSSLAQSVPFKQVSLATQQPPSFFQPLSSLPPHSHSVIMKCRAENELLRRDQQLFDPRYASWLAAFLRQCTEKKPTASRSATSDSSNELLSAAAWQATACYLFDTAAHSRDKARFPSLVALLRNGLTIAPANAANEGASVISNEEEEDSTSGGVKRPATPPASDAEEPVKAPSAKKSATAKQRASAGWFLEQLVGPRQWHRALLSCPQPLVRQAVAEIALLAFQAVLPALATGNSATSWNTPSSSSNQPTSLPSPNASSPSANCGVADVSDHLAAISWLHSDPNGADCVPLPPPLVTNESTEAPTVSASDQIEMRRSVEFLHLVPSSNHSLSSISKATGEAPLEVEPKRMRSDAEDGSSRRKKDTNDDKSISDSNEDASLLLSLLPPPPLPRLRWWRPQKAPTEPSPFECSSGSPSTNKSGSGGSHDSSSHGRSSRNSSDRASVSPLSNAESSSAMTTAAATAAATALGCLLDLCAELPSSVGGCWQRGRELLTLLADVASLGPAACVLLVRVGAVPRLVDLLMGPHSKLVPLQALSLEAMKSNTATSHAASSSAAEESTSKGHTRAGAAEEEGAHVREVTDGDARRPPEHPLKTTSPRSGEPPPGPLDCLPLARCFKALLQHLAPPPWFLAADAPWRLQCTGNVTGANALRSHRRDARRSLKVDSSFATKATSKAGSESTAAVPITIDVDDDDDDDDDNGDSSNNKEGSAGALGGDAKEEEEYDDPTAGLFETPSGSCKSLSGVENLFPASHCATRSDGSDGATKDDLHLAESAVGAMSRGWWAEPAVANVGQCRPPGASLLVPPSALPRQGASTGTTSLNAAVPQSNHTTTKRRKKQAASHQARPNDSVQATTKPPKAEDEVHDGIVACFPLDDWQLLLREGLVLSKLAAAAQLETSSSSSSSAPQDASIANKPPLTSELCGIVQLLAYGSPPMSARLIALCGHKLACLPDASNSSGNNNKSSAPRTLGMFQPRSAASNQGGTTSSTALPWKHMFAALARSSNRDGLQQWRATQATRELLTVARLGANLPNASKDGWSCAQACRAAIIKSSRQAFSPSVVYSTTSELWGAGKQAPLGVAGEALSVLTELLKEQKRTELQLPESSLGVHSTARSSAAVCVRNALLARPMDWSVMLWACPESEHQTAARQLAEALASQALPSLIAATADATVAATMSTQSMVETVVDLSGPNSDGESNLMVADQSSAGSVKRMKRSESDQSAVDDSALSSAQKRPAGPEDDSSSPKKAATATINVDANVTHMPTREAATLEAEVEHAHSALLLLRAVLPTICAGLDDGDDNGARGNDSILLLKPSSGDANDASSSSSRGNGVNSEVLKISITSGCPPRIAPCIWPAEGLEHRPMLEDFGSVSGTPCAASEASCAALWATVSRLPSSWKDECQRSKTEEEAVDARMGYENADESGAPATSAGAPDSSSSEKELLARSDWLKRQGCGLLAAWAPPLLAMLIHQNIAANGLGGISPTSNHDPRQRSLLKTVHALTQGWPQTIAKSLAAAAIAAPTSPTSSSSSSSSSSSIAHLNNTEAAPSLPLPESCLASKLFLYQLHCHHTSQACAACHESATLHLYGILQDLCRSGSSSSVYRESNNITSSGARLATVWCAHSNWKWCQRTFVLGNFNVNHQNLTKEALSGICAKYQKTAQAILSLNASLLSHSNPIVACAACQAAISVYVLERHLPQRVESLPISSGGLQALKQLAVSLRKISQNGSHFDNKNDNKNGRSKSADRSGAAVAGVTKRSVAEVSRVCTTALAKALVDENVFGVAVRLLQQGAHTAVATTSIHAALAAAAAAVPMTTALGQTSAEQTPPASSGKEVMPMQAEAKTAAAADDLRAAQPGAARVGGEGQSASAAAGKAKGMMKNWLSMIPKAKKTPLPVVEVVDGIDGTKAPAPTAPKEIAPAPAATTAVANHKEENDKEESHGDNETWQLISVLLELVLGLAPTAAAATSAHSGADATTTTTSTCGGIAGIECRRAPDPAALASALKALEEPYDASIIPRVPSTLHPGKGLEIEMDSRTKAPAVKKRKKERRNEASAGSASSVGYQDDGGSHADWIKARDELGFVLLPLVETFFVHNSAATLARIAAGAAVYPQPAVASDGHLRKFDHQVALALQLCFTGDPILSLPVEQNEGATPPSDSSIRIVKRSLLIEVLARVAGVKPDEMESEANDLTGNEDAAPMDTSNEEEGKHVFEHAAALLEKSASSGLLPMHSGGDEDMSTSSSSSSGWQRAISTSGPLADVIFSAWRGGLATQLASISTRPSPSRGAGSFVSPAAQALVDVGLAAATVAFRTLTAGGGAATSSAVVHAATMTHLAALAASDAPPTLLTAVAASPSLSSFLLALASCPVFPAGSFKGTGVTRSQMAVCRAAVVTHLVNGDTWSALQVEEKREISSAVAKRALALLAAAERSEATEAEATEADAREREAAHWAMFCRGQPQFQAPDGASRIERAWL